MLRGLVVFELLFPFVVFVNLALAIGIPKPIGKDLYACISDNDAMRILPSWSAMQEFSWLTPG